MRKRLHLRVFMLVVLIATLVLAGCGAPQQVSPAPAPVSAPGLEAVSAAGNAPRGTPQEGIKVHGRWTIEVRNPDGSLAERREFENALTLSGADRLASVLARALSVGGWKITLSGTNSPFVDEGGNPIYAEIVEPSYAGTFNSCFKTLTVTKPASGPDQNKLLLSGTATAQRNGTIELVLTRWELLSPTSPPSSNYSGASGGDFTGTTLTGANIITLVNGQQLTITVAISFS